MGSLYLNGLSQDDYAALKQTLLSTQQGKCFICEQPLDLQIQESDVDHVEPISLGGRDDDTNFAVTHATCNRSKQASDLRVAGSLPASAGSARSA